MVMVPLDPALDPDMTTRDARSFLTERDFDLSLVRGDEVRVVYREALAGLGEKRLALPVKANSNPPRMDRLVEHSLELAAVARRLDGDPAPLLVVGRDGPAFVITRADFSRAAGQMGVLSVIAALDASLDLHLAPFDAEGWRLLDREEQALLEDVAARAARRGEQLPAMRFLSLGQRFRLVRKLCLPDRLGVEMGSQPEHELVICVRNDIAHGREIQSGGDAIKALLVAERILDSLMNQA